MEVYDTIGTSYNTTRKADPYIVKRIYDLLQPAPTGLYLDIGCGTGNYLNALVDKGLSFYGIDPSETMLQQARGKNITATFLKAKAESIALPDNFFDGAIAVLTVHHWEDVLAGLKEMNRLLKPNTNLVFFSYTPQQVRRYWLSHYFPKMIDEAARLIPPVANMKALLEQAGFSAIVLEPYSVQKDLQDQFMYSNKYRPEQYLLQSVRDGASGFRLAKDQFEIEQGLRQLKNDIHSGFINEVIVASENESGDYLFIKAIAN